MAQTQPTNSQIIHAPSPTKQQHPKSIFLAGTTSPVDANARDWRETLSASLADVPVTIYNPYRPDWDTSWREDISFAPYREQVEWELEKLECADVVVLYFHPETKAVVSLLELGLCVRMPGKAVVVCPEGFWKRGNVQVVCERFGVEMVDEVEGLREAVVRRVVGGD